MTRCSDKRLFAAGSISILLLCGFAVPSSLHPHANQTSSAIEVPIVVTAAPAYEPLAALGLDQSSDPSVAYAGERFPRSAHLLILRNGRAESLLPQFFASADPNVSFDAQKMLFAGRQYAEDPWKIWEMNLADRSVRKVISAESDLIRPFYLPGSRVVYARRTLTSFQVETASLDGTEVLQLTYLNSSALPVDVLLDGRILFESGFPLGTAGKPELYLVYSDGSGVESYRCDHGTARWGGHQLASGPNAGDIVFSHGQSLGRFTSPLGAEAVISTPTAMPFLWKLHPAFAVTADHRIDFPRMTVVREPGFAGTLGDAPLSFPWPMASINDIAGERTLDLRQVPDASSRALHFFYGTEMAAGWCAITDKSKALSAGLRFDPEVFPSCWLFASHGGWRNLNVAVLEPSTGYPFQLQAMIDQCRAPWLKPGESLETEVLFTTQEGLTSVGGIEANGAILQGRD